MKVITIHTVQNIECCTLFTGSLPRQGIVFERLVLFCTTRARRKVVSPAAWFMALLTRGLTAEDRDQLRGTHTLVLFIYANHCEIYHVKYHHRSQFCGVNDTDDGTRF